MTLRRLQRETEGPPYRHKVLSGASANEEGNSVEAPRALVDWSRDVTDAWGCPPEPRARKKRGDGRERRG